jgi:cell division protein FtsB
MQRITAHRAVVRTTAESLLRFRRTLATLGVGLLALFLGLHVIFGHNGMLAYQRKRAEYQKLQEDLDRLQKDNDRISQQIRELKSDPKAIEREAREQLRYARPGEVVYTIPEPVRPQPPVSATAQKR